MKQIPERIRRVEKVISSASGVSVHRIRGHSRKREHADARAAVWMIANKYLGYSCAMLARLYNRADHTTVVYAIQKIEESGYAMKIVNGVLKSYPNMLQGSGESAAAKRIDMWEF